MNGKEALQSSIAFGDKVAQAYLADLTDADLLVRPVPGANHIAWQLGHLASAEHDLIEMVAPGSMPKLPAGFKEKHSKQTAASDDPKAFCSKAEYLTLLKEQRAGTLAALAKMSEPDLSKPAPEPVRSHLDTVGDVFSMQGGHLLMHAGQWAVVRRKLGRKPLF
ncbi:MAG: DinB family protein [Planctomycetia bacterium]|nr:DinB family protein [Planctomycetia bacterium]